MKKRILTSLITGALLVSTALSLTACGSQQSQAGATDAAQTSGEKTTVSIAYLPITHALPVFELKNELEADNSNLQVELVKYGSWPELLEALNTGKVDAASVLVELAMKSKQENNDLKLAALGHRDGNVIVANDTIQSVKDLKGKTFAIPHRQSSHNILMNLALQEAGLTAEDLNVVELAPTEMPSALTSGQIDAYCVAEPFGAKGVSLGKGHVLKTSEELWKDSLCCGLVLNGSFIEKNGETAKTLVKSYEAAGDHLDKTTAFDVAKQYLGQDDDILKTSLQWISYNDLAIEQKVYDSLTKKMVEFKLTDNPPTYEDFVYQPEEA
ncbi:MAG: ABC transporter substrate-binding protein [Oscillospiraceae bacterium]|nr:ABC transporter substrate-binding protein [Oscillospiraceae bacterium]